MSDKYFKNNFNYYDGYLGVSYGFQSFLSLLYRDIDFFLRLINNIILKTFSKIPQTEILTLYSSLDSLLSEVDVDEEDEEGRLKQSKKEALFS